MDVRQIADAATVHYRDARGFPYAQHLAEGLAADPDLVTSDLVRPHILEMMEAAERVDGLLECSDYILYLTASQVSGRLSIATIIRGMLRAAQLAPTQDFGYAWDLALATVVTLRGLPPAQMAGSAASDHLATLLSHVITEKLPVDREPERAANCAQMASLIPSWFLPHLLNVLAARMTEDSEGANRAFAVASAVAPAALGSLSHDAQLGFILAWTSHFTHTTGGELLSFATITAMAAFLDADLPREVSNDVCLRLLQLVRLHPTPAKLEYVRQLMFIARKRDLSGTVVQQLLLQAAIWTSSVDPPQSQRLLRELRSSANDRAALSPAQVASASLVEASLRHREGDREGALRAIESAAAAGGAAPEIGAMVRAANETLGIVSRGGSEQGSQPYAARVTTALAHATRLLRAEDYESVLQVVAAALELRPQPDESASPYTRRRLLLLAAAAHWRLKRPNAVVDTILLAVDEVADEVIHRPGGTAQNERLSKFAEVENLIDRALIVVASDPTALAHDRLLNLWARVMRYRDIELESFDMAYAAAALSEDSTGVTRRYVEARDRLASAELHGCTEGPAEQWVLEVLDLRRQLHYAELVLLDVPELHRRVQDRLKTDVGDVIAQLEPESMLVEFVSYWTGLNGDRESIYGTLAFCVSASSLNEVAVFNTCSIGASHERIFEVLSDLDKRPHHQTQTHVQIDESVMARTLKNLAHRSAASRMVVVPDGAVTTTNLNALQDEGGFVGDEICIEYVGNSLDLLLAPNQYKADAACVIGDPTFGGLSDNTDPVDSAVQFEQLVGSQWECSVVVDMLGADTNLFTGREATKQSLLSAGTPRVLHISTHGYFFQGLPSGTLIDDEPELGALLNFTARGPLHTLRPMDQSLRSGLALAGANFGSQGHLPAIQRGILTAHDVASLNLHGTAIAVLAGCKTGLGPVERYKGLVDLRRAFRVAGVASVMVSLWSVPDVATALLMRLLYDTAEDIPTAADLCRAQRCLREATVTEVADWLREWDAPEGFGGRYMVEVLRADPNHHPFAAPRYWAGFVMYTTGRVKDRRVGNR